MTQVWCAQRIASLEGGRAIALPSDLSEISLESLDTRLRRLEHLALLTSPPPMLEPTWESLEYRLRQLIRKEILLPRVLQVPPLHQNADGEKSETNMRTLEVILHEISGRQGGGKKDNVANTFGDKGSPVSFVAISQQFCHAAGRKGIKSPDSIRDFDELYAFAVELSLEVQARPQATVPPPMARCGPGVGHGVRPGGMNNNNNTRAAKACCGCCSCACHGGNLRQFHVTHAPSRKRRYQRFAWLKRLWCFGSKKKDDDSSSTSSSTIHD
ncbi:hypothetical protein QBC33DRAFT_516241 [Phialemonium atrogriseum]|uniref:Uncharacterized protein n=1 Tax=Phialemonium atrogriseum TaxID=1093897 RepID=A0AAJ0FKF4_9PEZI|nr:uncharacterized protein QBC33DRAFT_516241 [Phialemonium atrogriseum]KAK1766348.1 hypothetical protein QBC33DRAFT_516241 [Phialemonium atrogriseum]